MSHDIFISHAHEDKTIADAVCATLEARGLRCWIAPRDILPGIDWDVAILDGISECKIFVLIFSSNTNRSVQIKHEIERAVHKGIPILPFRVEEVMPSKSLEYFLSTPHWLDALTPPFEQHLERLAETARLLTSHLISSEVNSDDTDVSSKHTSAEGQWSQITFCIHCGAKLNPDFVYCIQCGRRINE